ncbi:hypothetical protein ABKN59_009658 [Abortiporus biennis]
MSTGLPTDPAAAAAALQALQAANGQVRIIAGACVWLIFIAAGLTGIMMMQAYIYFLYSAPKDSKFMKVFCVILVLLELLHTIFSVYPLYVYLVLDYGNPLALARFLWSTGAAFAISTIIVAMVQLVYIRKLWLLTNQIVIPILLAIVLFMRAGAYLALIGLLYHFEDWQDYYAHPTIACLYIALGLTVFSDVMIAFVQFMLRRQTKTSKQIKFKTANKFLEYFPYLLRSWLLSGAVSAGALIAFIIKKDSWVWLGLVAVAMKLYATSLFSSFNSHRSLRHNIARAHSTNAESFEPLPAPSRIEILREISAVSDNQMKVSRADVELGVMRPPVTISTTTTTTYVDEKRNSID